MLSSPDEFPQQITAFVWEEGAVTALTALYRGVTQSSVHDINHFGVVVGESLPEGAEETVATLWPRGVLHDLNQLVSADDLLRSTVTLLFTSAINDRGQIVAGARCGFLA